jgi:5-bromo-4-chloroindolyl phosphate hydrolysis protein
MIDDSPISSFTFSLQRGNKTKDELNSKFKTLSDRIDNLVNQFTIDDMPVLKPILNLTHSKSDLKRLAKALDRVADLIEVHDQLESKLKVLELAQSEPNWFASAFGDFETEIDSAIDKLMSGD